MRRLLLSILPGAIILWPIQPACKQYDLECRRDLVIYWPRFENDYPVSSAKTLDDPDSLL